MQLKVDTHVGVKIREKEFVNPVLEGPSTSSMVFSVVICRLCIDLLCLKNQTISLPL